MYGSNGNKWRLIAIVSLICGVFVSFVNFAGWLQPGELAFLDFCFRNRLQEQPDPRIVIVEVTEADIRRYRWPLSDEVLAQLIKIIAQQQPVVIGLDIYRDLPVEPGYAELVQVFKATNNLIGIEKTIGESGDSPAVAPPPVLANLNRVASIDVVTDVDRVLRRTLLYPAPNEHPEKTSLGLELAFRYLAKKGFFPESDKNGNLQIGKAVFPPFEENDGAYVRADAGSYQILINYRGPAKTFKSISVSEVLSGKNLPILRNRIVLIGHNAESINDFFYTPYSSVKDATPERTTGVEIQANIVSQIVSSVLDNRLLIHYWHNSFDYVWIFLWAAVGSMIVTLPSINITKIGRVVSLFFSLLLATIAIICFSYFSFVTKAIWILALAPFYSLIFAFGLTLFLIYIKQLKITIIRLQEAHEDIIENFSKLEEREEFISLAANAASAGFMKWDFSTDKIALYYINKDFFNIHTPYLNTNFDNFINSIHLSDKYRFEQIYSLYLKGEELFEFEFRFRNFEGYLCWAFFKGKVFHTSQNKFSILIGTIVNLDQKKTFDKILSIQKRYWEVLLETSNNIVFVLDNNFSILDITSSIKKVLGFDRDEKINTQFINIIHPKHEQTILFAFQQVIAQPDTTSRFDLYLRHKAHSWKPVVAEVSYLKKSIVTGLVINCYDITTLSTTPLIE